MSFNFRKFKTAQKSIAPSASEQIYENSRLENKIYEQLMFMMPALRYRSRKSKSFEESMRTKGRFKFYVKQTDVFHKTKNIETLKDYGEFRNNFDALKDLHWYQSIPQDEAIKDQVKVTYEPSDLISEFSSTQKVIDPITNSENIVCYFCGRPLFNNIFDDAKIQIEHLYPKKVLAKKLADATEALINLDKGSFDFDNPENKKAISYIKTIVEGNAINSLYNWALADSQCNTCKASLNQNEFVAYMAVINSVDAAQVVDRNEKIYNEAAARNDIQPSKDASQIFEGKKIRSAQIYLQILIDAIEGSGLAFEGIENFYVDVADDTNRLNQKFLRLSALDEVKTLFNESNFRTLVNNFQALSKYTDEIRKNKQILYHISSMLECPICGIAVDKPSPSGKKASFQISDVTLAGGAPRTQLIHSDCVDFVASLSLPALKELAALITSFTPTRQAIAKEKIHKITEIFDDLDKYTDYIKSQAKTTKLSKKILKSFNLFRGA